MCRRNRFENNVEYKVKVDSDVPIAEVALACGSQQQVRALGGGNQIARFNTRPGSCSVRFNGPVAMTTHVNVPATGRRCTLCDSGRASVLQPLARTLVYGRGPHGPFLVWIVGLIWVVGQRRRLLPQKVLKLLTLCPQP